ncbi:13638_t:CDS:2, partial [Gigaspora margarita]
ERKNRNAEYHDIVGSSRVDFWNSIANKMNERFRTIYTGYQCKDKLRNLVNSHNRNATSCLAHIDRTPISKNYEIRISHCVEKYFDEFRSRFWERPGGFTSYIEKAQFDQIHNANTSARRREESRHNASNVNDAGGDSGHNVDDTGAIISTVSSQNDSDIKTSNWSLIKYLQYRRKREDFSYEKAKEHLNYKKALEALSSCVDYGKKARQCLGTLENERFSERVNKFWMAINEELTNDKIKAKENEYDLTLTTNVNEQMGTYVNATTSRLTKQFLKSTKESPPKHVAKNLMEDDHNNPLIASGTSDRNDSDKSYHP